MTWGGGGSKGTRETRMEEKLEKPGRIQRGAL